ncbi:MAG: ABC transporter permease [Acidocella sp.]|nr:ABC transporter permease [Acidocella sp.]
MNIITPETGQAGSHIEAEMSQVGRPPGRPVTITATPGWHGKIKMARADIALALRLWPLVWTLSLLDIRLRYRGSLLGPFWLTLSTAVMVGSIGFLYSHLFHQNVAAYLPFLSISLVLWAFISTVTAEGCMCYTASEGMIRAMRMPLSLHAIRVVLRNILVLAHNIVVIVVVFVIFRVVPSAAVISLPPALALWAVDAFAVSLMLGIFGARFRDIPPIIGSIMQIAFYLTPVMWNPVMLMHRGVSAVLVKWNPFYALLEIVRGPLLGGPLEPQVWALALGYSAVLIAISGVVFLRARARIAYWV